MSSWDVVIGILMILFGMWILPPGTTFALMGLAGVIVHPSALDAGFLGLGLLMAVGGLYFIKWGVEEILDVAKEICCNAQRDLPPLQR
mgnify:FL=1